MNATFPMSKTNKQDPQTTLLKVLKRSKQEQKSMKEEIEKLNKLLNLFIYSTSHDLRGPILTIKGLTKLIKNEISQGQVDLYLDLINRVIENHELCLQNYREMLSESKNIYQSQQVDFKELVECALQSLEYLDKNNEVTKILKITSSEKPFKADPAYLKVILQNLISNALKFHRNGENNKWLEIEIDINNTQCVIMVKDNGIGINHETELKMFDMFYRGTDRNHGPGLGLYIAKKLVKSMNGNVFLDRQTYPITCFRVELPNKL